MKIKAAIVQCAHPGSFESLCVILNAVGIQPLVPNSTLLSALITAGCDTVVPLLSIADAWGWSIKADNLGVATSADMKRKDVIYVDIKAHRNGYKVWEKWPELFHRTLWYRINGARPCIVPGKGDELDPPCPVLTPDPWYNKELDFNKRGMGTLPQSTLDKSYSCWPPFRRWEFHQYPRTTRMVYDPVCMVHNLHGWGYGDVGMPLRRSIGLKCYGGHGSPDGMLSHSLTPETLSLATCMVHLKSQDCPGYSLYEALASACPVVCSRMMIDWCKMHDLFIPGETCVCYDKGSSEGGTKDGTVEKVDVAACIEEIERCFSFLKLPEYNKKIGEAGRSRLKSVMWDSDKIEDVESLRSFFERMYP